MGASGALGSPRARPAPSAVERVGAPQAHLGPASETATRTMSAFSTCEDARFLRRPLTPGSRTRQALREPRAPDRLPRRRFANARV